MEKLKRTIFNKELWHCTTAIFRYIPRALVTKRVDGMQFYTPEKYNEFKARIEQMNSGAPRQWGTMGLAQMLHHLNLAVGGALGYYELPDESYWVARTFFKWILIDWFSEQPVGLRLPLNFVIRLTDQFDFEKEKKQLLAILDKACHIQNADGYGPHCLFGRLTLNEWGKLSVIHIDYHLKQFAG